MITIGKIVSKTYKDPKEFLKDFEIEAIIKDGKTIDYIKEIIENSKTLHISINLSNELLDEEVLDKITDLWNKINDKTDYSFEICEDNLSSILDNIENGISDIVADYIINLLKELKLNKLILYKPTSHIIPYQVNPPNKYRASIDESVYKIYSLIKESKSTYEVSIPFLCNFYVILLDNKHLHYKKVCSIASPLNEVFSERMIEDEEFGEYKEEYERIIEFYKKLNQYLITLLDKLNK